MQEKEKVDSQTKQRKENEQRAERFQKVIARHVLLKLKEKAPHEPPLLEQHWRQFPQRRLCASAALGPQPAFAFLIAGVMIATPRFAGNCETESSVASVRSETSCASLVISADSWSACAFQKRFATQREVLWHGQGPSTFPSVYSLASAGPSPAGR